MSDRADYYIEKVRYNTDHTRIVQVSVRENAGTKLGKPHAMPRKQVIDLLKQGKSFMTIFRNEEGKYRPGEGLHMASLNGVSYLRTDREHVKVDHLNNLPEY
jgi:hypothetical protein